MEKVNLMSLAELRKSYCIPFTPGDFIGNFDSYEGPYVPVPTVPRYLFTEDEVEKAGKALTALHCCSDILGGWLMIEPDKVKTPEYQKVAAEFKSITGVDPLEIFKLARSRFVKGTTSSPLF